MNKQKGKQEDLLEVIYYTDPLCCWSWAFEPQWRRLVYELKDKLNYRYCMGGLIPTWKNYNDSINSVTRPLQMGPVWMHAKELSGMPVEHNIWMRDPPSSSYPACIAVKAAGLQSKEAEENLLRLLREAVMIDGANIAKQEVIFSVAEKLANIDQEFDAETFQEDFKGDNAVESFRKDLQEVQMKNISRFPTLIIKNQNNKAILVSGYRPYSFLIKAIKQLGDISELETINTEDYKQYWPSLTHRELQEIG